MVLFSAGWTAVYGLFLLLHLHVRGRGAYMLRDELAASATAATEVNA